MNLTRQQLLTVIDGEAAHFAASKPDASIIVASRAVHALDDRKHPSAALLRLLQEAGELLLAAEAIAASHPDLTLPPPF